MYQYPIKFTIFCWLVVVLSTHAAPLISPCPNIFTYDGEPENDRWYGVVTFSSNIELVGLTYKIQLDRPGHLLVSWDGEVRSDDNINFSVFDPNHFQRAGEVVKARIMVKFNPSSPPPNVVKVIINGNTMCSGDNNTPLTLGAAPDSSSLGVGRPDPFSVNEDIVPEYNSRPNNQNINSGYEKGNRPNYYESSGTSYEANSGSSPNYGGGGSNYASSSNTANYQQPIVVSSNPSSYPNNNPHYITSQNNYVPAENVVYPSNHQPSSGFSNSQSQWSTENQQTSSGFNRNSSNQVANVPIMTVANVPIVTTLSIPNNTQNKNNVDSILQAVKNQLEQQVASNTNSTVILVVPPPSGSQSRDSLIETTHRTTIASTQSSVVVSNKVRTTMTPTSATKVSVNRNKD